MKYIILINFFISVGCNFLLGENNLKVICASRAEIPPIINGVLNDTCWRKTEIRDDFVFLATHLPRRRTTIRFLYDDDNIYLGIECFFDNITKLKKGISNIKGKENFSNGYVNIKNFTNRYSIEVFFDPGRSKVKHYQILFNAAGQICGHFKGDFNYYFSPKPYFKSKINGKCLTWEFVFPIQKNDKCYLKPGEEWGFNIVRNDELPFSMWKIISGSYNEPKSFGCLIIGDYKEWWNTVWNKKTKTKLAEIDKKSRLYGKDEMVIKQLYWLVVKKVKKIEKIEKRYPPENRKNFEVLYQNYTEFLRVFERLGKLCKTQELIYKIQKSSSPPNNPQR